MLSMILSAPTIFTQKLSQIDQYCGNFCYEDWGSHNSRRRAYGTVMLTLQFIIPLSIIIVCYTAISVRLGQSLILKTKKRDYEWQLQMTDQQRAANKRRQRTNRMFIGKFLSETRSWHNFFSYGSCLLLELVLECLLQCPQRLWYASRIR